MKNATKEKYSWPCRIKIMTWIPTSMLKLKTSGALKWKQLQDKS